MDWLLLVFVPLLLSVVLLKTSRLLTAGILSEAVDLFVELELELILEAFLSLLISNWHSQ